MCRYCIQMWCNPYFRSVAAEWIFIHGPGSREWRGNARQHVSASFCGQQKCLHARSAGLKWQPPSSVCQRGVLLVRGQLLTPISGSLSFPLRDELSLLTVKKDIPDLPPACDVFLNFFFFFPLCKAFAITLKFRSPWGEAALQLQSWFTDEITTHYEWLPLSGELETMTREKFQNNNIVISLEKSTVFRILAFWKHQ